MSDVIPWGEWRPDVSSYKGQHSPSIVNAIPRGDGYGPAKSFAALTDALPAACRGFFTYYHTDGTIRVFAGTSTDLWLLDNSDLSWDNVTNHAAAAIDLSGALASAYIGDMTDGGGLNDAFDGDVTENAASGAAKTSATTAYVGVTFATATRIKAAKVHGSDDAGFISGANDNVTFTLYGKTGAAPSTSTDGTEIGTIAAAADTTNESAGRSFTITDSTTEWLHVWCKIDQAGSAAQLNIAELALTTSATYSLGTTAQWQFAPFGTRVIAVNANDDPQSFVVGSSSAFADLTGATSLDASHVAIVGEFVVFSGIAATPMKIQWSSRSVATEWTPGTNEGDEQEFFDGGLVRGMAGGEYGLVFQDSMIRRMTYQPGSAVIFSFDKLTDEFGLLAPYSIVRAGDATFFLSHDGFQMYHPLTGFKPIGKERVDRTFLADCDLNNKRLIVGTSDPAGPRILWAYKSVQGAEGLLDRIIVYDYVLDRWAGFVNISGEFISTAAIPGVTLENLDSISSSIDALSTSLDDFPTGFAKTLAMAGSTHVIGLLSGPNLEATLQTAEIVGPGRVYIRGHRPITDCTSVMGSVLTRQRSADAASFGTESSVNEVGFCPHHADTRLLQIKNRFPAASTWSYSVGVEPDMVSTGQR